MAGRRSRSRGRARDVGPIPRATPSGVPNGVTNNPNPSSDDSQGDKKVVGRVESLRNFILHGKITPTTAADTTHQHPFPSACAGDSLDSAASTNCSCRPGAPGHPTMTSQFHPAFLTPLAPTGGYHQPTPAPAMLRRRSKSSERLGPAPRLSLAPQATALGPSGHFVATSAAAAAGMVTARVIFWSHFFGTYGTFFKKFTLNSQYRLV